jgi:uncharacterized membrane protein YgcG
VLSRSAGNPIIVGLGTAAILAAGAGPALAAPTPTPKPSPTASDDAPTTPASMLLSVLDSSLKAGETATANVRVVSGSKGFDGLRVRLTVGKPGTAKALVCPAGSTVLASGCNLSALKSGTGAVRQTFTAPQSAVDDEAAVTVTASLTRDGAPVVTKSVRVTFTSTKTDPDDTAPPVPPKTTPKPTPKPSLKPGKGKGPSDKKDGNNNSGGGAGGGNHSGGSGSGSGSGSGGYVPPTPNGTFNPSTNKSPQVALPPISAPSPSVAAPAANSTGAITPDSKLRSNEKPVAEDLTFQRMASTQIAWLAALLVAFSLLMTQLRLGRRNGPGSPAALRLKGSHRRPRRGLFGK